MTMIDVMLVVCFGLPIVALSGAFVVLAGMMAMNDKDTCVAGESR